MPARGSYKPEVTRQHLLEAAFAEIHRNGFRAASLDNILAATGVTKGALYHHFGSKTKLGYAIVEEKIGPMITDMWVEPLEGAENPVGTLIQCMKEMAPSEEELEVGCPLNNIAIEMAPIDEGFRIRLESIFHKWRKAVAKAIHTSYERGYMREGISPESVAALVVSAMEGMATLAKSSQDITIFNQSMNALIAYLKSLQKEPTPT